MIPYVEDCRYGYRWSNIRSPIIIFVNTYIAEARSRNLPLLHRRTNTDELIVVRLHSTMEPCTEPFTIEIVSSSLQCSSFLGMRCFWVVSPNFCITVLSAEKGCSSLCDRLLWEVFALYDHPNRRSLWGLVWWIFDISENIFFVTYVIFLSRKMLKFWEYFSSFHSILRQTSPKKRMSKKVRRKRR